MAFLAGDDDFQALEDDLAQGFHARNQEIAEATERLMEEQEAQEAELAQYGSAPSPLEQLQATKSTFTNDVQQFNTLIANLTAHLKKVQARLQKLQGEDRSRDEELENLAANIARLQAVKDQQEMTPADVDQINNARAKLDRQMKQITTRKVSRTRNFRAAPDRFVLPAEHPPALPPGCHALGVLRLDSFVLTRGARPSTPAGGDGSEGMEAGNAGRKASRGS